MRRLLLGAAALIAVVLLPAGRDASAMPTSSACDRSSSLAGYRTRGHALRGDLDGDRKADRVTVRANVKRPPRCRFVLVVETGRGGVVVLPVKPLPWFLAVNNPRLTLLAEIDGRAGLEAVVELSWPPASVVYRPGAVFTMRERRLVRMRYDVEAKLPDDVFPFYDEFPVGVNCGAQPGTVVVTRGGLAKRGRDDRHYDITRSLYRAAGTRFVLLRRTKYRVGIRERIEQRWPELRGPFLSCPHQVR